MECAVPCLQRHRKNRGFDLETESETRLESGRVTREFRQQNLKGRTNDTQKLCDWCADNCRPHTGQPVRPRGRHRVCLYARHAPGGGSALHDGSLAQWKRFRQDEACGTSRGDPVVARLYQHGIRLRLGQVQPRAVERHQVHADRASQL